MGLFQQPARREAAAVHAGTDTDNPVPSRASALASCIMPTANRRRFVPHAIRCFLAQDYTEKELVILDDGDESVEDLVPPHPQIRYIWHSGRESVGAKRNRACEEASGEIIVHWDDDDWSAPWRLSYQVRTLLAAGADLCGLARVFFADFEARRAWEYVYPQGAYAWVHGATLCYRKRLWRRSVFPDVNVGEDSHFVWTAHGARLLALPDNRFLSAWFIMATPVRSECEMRTGSPGRWQRFRHWLRP